MTVADRRLAYLGPPGTFAEVAARHAASDDDELVALPEIADVIRAVSDGLVQRAVVPIENAIEGSVTATLDTLAFDVDVSIVAEIEIAVTLVLAAAPGTGLDEVGVVRSHPVALAACRRWLSANLPLVERVDASSTARAAQLVAAAPGEAAIVNPIAVARYGLRTLADDIADHGGNATRFVVVGAEQAAATGYDKTSVVVFIVENRPGALLRLLRVFADRELNLTKIESRPTKKELGEYCFFLDVEGHVSDPLVADALAALRRSHRGVKLLGSYPRAGRASAADSLRRP